MDETRGESRTGDSGAGDSGTTREGAFEYSLEAALSRATSNVDKVADNLTPGSHVSGLPGSSPALVLARAYQKTPEPRIVIVPSSGTARRMADDLRIFLGPEAPPVLVFPSADVSPYLEVAPDRQSAMDRLAAIAHVRTGKPWSFLVCPAAAVARRCPPWSALESRLVHIRSEEELDHEGTIRALSEAGYMRVPVAEDPGTFAVRGSLLDVFPTDAATPVRVEFDDWLVLSFKNFDPDTQRTLAEVREVSVPPARETLTGEAEVERAKVAIRDLCDAVNMPTTQAKQLLDDVDEGRTFFGMDALMPAFYERVETVFDHAGDAPVVLVDPPAVANALVEEKQHAEEDRAARTEDASPAYPLDVIYMTDTELLEVLGPAPRIHQLAIMGAPHEDEGPLMALSTAEPGAQLGGDDQAALSAALNAKRGGDGQALLPLKERSDAWLAAGLRVVFTARTRTQADRLSSLLKAYGVKVASITEAPNAKFWHGSGRASSTGAVEIVIGPVGGGFVLPTEGLAVVTDDEIFGSRSHRRTQRRKKTTASANALSDLRELAVGDYVVHIEYGIGKYLGLERKSLGQSAYERMKGHEAPSVELLVVEYAGGDKLFLPVTRLNQIQKYASQSAHKPKLDKLGGQTFAKTKAKVRKQVRQMADELLKLYAERAAVSRPSLPPAGRDFAEFEATFPFEETRDQAKAIDAVLGDLEADTPMDRVVCGDVGFGKTEVALRAAFRVAMAGKQVAVLCPTTVLAQQHFHTFESRLREYPLKVGVLSRFVSKKQQTEVLAGVKDGTIDVLVGTHRLLSKDVHFAKLGLLVVDEEQRFGVTHKERIKSLKKKVDVLTLSATPIPRTLQMAVGGIRDLSLITTAPVDRRAVRTFVSRWDDHIIKEAITREMNRGGQSFFVYNRIEGLYERGQKLQELLPNARIAVAHGQMKEGELEKVMLDFVEGQYDVLCSTAIIESGLDIPRANTMIVDRSDLFGLAQLYQLRGRVGRSRERAYCYLLTPPPQRMTDDARYRIQALERFTELGSGFQVASLDMELRGAGDILGAEQSGNVSAVGFDLFLQMLNEAVAQLRGDEVTSDVDPEMNFDVELYIPDDYVDDVGVRLSLYKRFASAPTDQDVVELAQELEDRFGAAPPPVRDLVRAMRLKPRLRHFRVLGCEAGKKRVTLHLKEDTPLDPSKVMGLVAQPGSGWTLTPDMKLTRRFADAPDSESARDGIERLEQLLAALQPLKRPQ